MLWKENWEKLFFGKEKMPAIDFCIEIERSRPPRWFEHCYVLIESIHI